MICLKIKRLDIRDQEPDWSLIEDRLIREAEPVSLFPLWEKNPSSRRVQFRMACSDTELLLRFEVREPSVKAEYWKDGDPVWNDSCVELFIQSCENDKMYYNFEFNAIGTCLSASGSGRNERKELDPLQYRKIRRYPELETEPFKETEVNRPWTLLIAIPFSLMGGAKVFSGKSTGGNVYKCGSGMKTPHYMAWSPVLTDLPDFHRPDFFGTFEFPVLLMNR